MCSTCATPAQDKNAGTGHAGLSRLCGCRCQRRPHRPSRFGKPTPPCAPAVLYALARQVQKRERLFAVLETLDNGKPIRETRDIDIPLVARHFCHHAGWGPHCWKERISPVRARAWGFAARSSRGIFRFLMLAWEKSAPALAAGNTVSAETGRRYAADGAPIRGNFAKSPVSRRVS